MPRLLDLFCGAGGAAMGYHRAGWDVVGVDLAPQPRYPFEFHQADALTYPAEGFDAVHASPPCQAYSAATRDPSRHPDLYAPTRRRLAELGLPWVIENVIGAPYSHGLILCGSMFGLEADGEWLRRHRNFEASWLMLNPFRCAHPRDHPPITVTGQAYLSVTRTVYRPGVRRGRGSHSRQGTFALAQRLMGVDWMTRREMAEAIPPAYTEWLGGELLTVIRGPAKPW